MKGLKRLFRFMILLVVLLLALAVALMVYINPLVKWAIEKRGSERLGVSVEVREVEIALLYGRAEVRGVRIGNPTGYSERPLFTLDRFLFDMDTRTLLGRRPIVINQVTLEGLAVSYEVLSGVSNVEALQKRMIGRKKRPLERVVDRSPRKVVIERFDSCGGSVAYSGAFTARKSVNIVLPEINIRDIGRYSGGVSPAEASQRILGEIMSGIGKAVTSASGSVVNTGGKVLDGAGHAVVDGLNAVGRGIKGIFK